MFKMINRRLDADNMRTMNFKRDSLALKASRFYFFDLMGNFLIDLLPYRFADCANNLRNQRGGSFTFTRLLPYE